AGMYSDSTEVVHAAKRQAIRRVRDALETDDLSPLGGASLSTNWIERLQGYGHRWPMSSARSTRTSLKTRWIWRAGSDRPHSICRKLSASPMISDGLESMPHTKRRSGSSASRTF